MAEHDVVVIGAGHNGLVVAAYLAKAGVDVCVVERMNVLGGAACTQELTLPGFKHDPGGTMHLAIVANPMIHQDELGLMSKYGFEYIYPEACVGFLFPDESSIIFHRDMEKTCKSIAQFSRRDAEVYPDFIKAMTQALMNGGPANFSPAASFGEIVARADSTPAGQDYLRILLSSVATIVDDWFESDQLKIACCRWSTELGTAPQDEATGSFMFFFPHFHRWGIAYAKGGSGKLSEALAACIEENKGTIRLSSPVKSIKAENGEARSVILESGEEIKARKAIVSNLNAKQLFLEMLAPTDTEADFQKRIGRLRHSFSALNQSIALNEPPHYKAGGEINEVACVELLPDNLQEIFDWFGGYSYGVPHYSYPTMAVQTMVDPTRAPDGKHTLYLYIFVPYHLQGGAVRWDEIKQEIADGALEALRARTTNMGPENILGRFIMSPLDLERWNPALIEGDIQHLSYHIPQYLTNRPLPSCSDYRTPVKKLYMCGASTHPSGGINGAGRAAVQNVMKDLGIDFKKVIGR